MPVESRKSLKDERGAMLAAECKGLYVKWLLEVCEGSEKKLDVFRSLAGGKTKFHGRS